MQGRTACDSGAGSGWATDGHATSRRRVQVRLPLHNAGPVGARLRGHCPTRSFSNILKSILRENRAFSNLSTSGGGSISNLRTAFSNNIEAEPCPEDRGGFCLSPALCASWHPAQIFWVYFALLEARHQREGVKARGKRGKCVRCAVNVCNVYTFTAKGNPPCRGEERFFRLFLWTCETLTG